MLESLKKTVLEALEYRSRLLSLCSQVLEELFLIEQDDLLPKIRICFSQLQGTVYYVMPGCSYVLSLDSSSYNYGSFGAAEKCELVKLDNKQLQSLLFELNVEFV